MTTSSKRFAFSACLCATLLSRVAFADPSAADLESARELYKEAKVLRDNGDLHGALEKFKAAHAYGQTPVTGLELGKAHAALGELVEAREAFLSVGRMKVASDESEKSTAARAEAAELAEQTRQRIPTLDLTVTGVPEGTTLALTVDGAAIPVVGRKATRKTNPGSHTIVAKAGGRSVERVVALKEGETRSESIAVPVESMVGPSSTASTASTASGHDGLGPITWVGAGVAVVGLGVGTVTGILALGKAGDVKDVCRDTSCPPSARDSVDTGRTEATVSTIGFIVGAAGVVAAAIGYFVLRHDGTHAKGPQVYAASRSQWLGLGGSF